MTTHRHRKDPGDRRPSITLVALVLVAVLAVGCSGSATTTITDTASEAEDERVASDIAQEEPTAPPAADEAEPTAEPESEPTDEAAPTAEPEPTHEPEPTDEASPDPEISFWADEIEPGDCINRAPGNEPFVQPDIVSCDEFHEEEVYATGRLDFGPGEPFPGRDALVDMAAAELCNDATIDFAGEAWDVLGIPTLVLFPTEEEWDAGDRFIGCSIVSPDEGEMMIGTAAGGSIDSDDVLLTRAGLAQDGADFDDWAVIRELDTVDTLGSLSNGQFALPLVRPFAVPQGFVFNAVDTGGGSETTSTFGYNWETREFTDLGAILVGQDAASTLVSGDRVVFATQADEDSDWDIVRTGGGSDEVIVLAGGAGDQRFPTLTPDGERVVYHDTGDLWVVDLDGDNRVQLTSGPANDWESTVSPDGTTVVFASDRSGNDDLWSVPIDGGEPVNLTDHPADENWPVFSPDGEYIYFGTDRLSPERDRNRLMVMNADGSEQSWFGAVLSSWAIVVDRSVADEVYESAPTLIERYNYDLLEGEPGTTVTWTDETGRLTADLPAGWRVANLDGAPGFIVSPRPSRYFDIWEVDGVFVRLYEGETEDEFFAHFDETAAVQNCEQFDGSDGIVPIEGTVVGISANHRCGTAGAVGGVLAFYDTATGVGVVIEGQRDNVPDEATDDAVITAIALSLDWG